MKPQFEAFAASASGEAKMVEFNMDPDSRGKLNIGFGMLKYKINQIPLVLVFRNGKVVARVEGYQTADQLRELLETAKQSVH